MGTLKGLSVSAFKGQWVNSRDYSGFPSRDNSGYTKETVINSRGFISY